MQTEFLNALGLDPQQSRIIAVVGGGGKTSLLWQLAEEYAAFGKRVILTTTTHMAIEEMRPFALDGNRAEIRKKLDQYGYVLTASVDRQKGKLAVPQDTTLESLRALCDVMIVEADGSKRLPLKVPADWEPVIPQIADTVIGVMGLDSLGRTIQETAHRPELMAAFLEKGLQDTVIEQDLVRIALSFAGLRKGVGERSYCVYLNKADVLEDINKAGWITEALSQSGVTASYGSLLSKWVKR
jgi:probable selenium-dependent hydroxylase accessory protein YqeC